MFQNGADDFVHVFITHDHLDLNLGRQLDAVACIPVCFTVAALPAPFRLIVMGCGTDAALTSFTHNFFELEALVTE